MAQIRGNFLYLIKKFFSETYGEAQYKVLLNELDEKGQKTLSGVIASGDMYDLKTYVDFLEIVDRRLGRQQLESFSKYISEKMLGGFFGFISRMISLDKLLNRSQFIWNRAFSQGTIKMTEYNDHQLKLEITDFEFNDAFLYSTMVYIRTWIEISTRNKTKGTIQKVSSTKYILSYFY